MPLEEFSTQSWQSGTEIWTDSLSGQQHEVAVGSIVFNNPTPAEGGPFYLFDSARGDGCEIAAGVNDLRNWFAPPQTLALRLPGSRFGHNLVVRHIDGTERAITQNQSQGGYTFDPALATAWWNFYYWFDGVGSAHGGVPWHVYDKTTDELAAVNSTDLTGWVSPWAGWQNTSATVADAVTISLIWTADLDDNNGSFIIERRTGNGPWQQVATVYGVDYSTSDSAWNPERQATLARYTYSSTVPSVPGVTNTFRLRYLYSSHYSSIALAGAWVPGDYDNDGLPTAWEVLHGFNPNTPNDSSVDSDGDGLSDWKEYLYGLNPAQPAITGAANQGYLSLTVFTPLE